VPWLRSRARVVSGTVRNHTAALMARDALITALESFLDTWDALICPVASGPAFPHCPSGTRLAVDDATLPYAIANVAHCLPFNVTGNPVVVLPVAQSLEGLPLGVQLVGPRWGDATLLALAGEIAKVIGPCSGPPGY
jgi:amidase